MDLLTVNDNAYVRPSPTRGTLGGIIDSTLDSVLLCEAAGYDVIIVESVGIGQSEVAIDETTDLLLFLVPPAGKEIMKNKCQ
jgi:LAO/AO transport system kinase